MTSDNRLFRALGCRATIALTLIKSERRVFGWDRSQRTPMLVGERLPVIFCTWRRLDRLHGTLAQLAAQDVPVQALVWNNSPDRGRVDAVARSAKIPVVVYHSPRNIGSFGRFYLAREAAGQGHHSVIFIDDDQDFGPGTVRDLLSARRPRALTGWWALGLRSADYGSRFLAAPGEAASLMGVGGMIADPAVFLDSRLYRCPRRYWFFDDIWLSYVAGHLCGYDLVRVGADFKFDESADDENALYRTLGKVKGNFLRYLIRQGWDPVRHGGGAPATAQRAGDDQGPVTAPAPGRSGQS
jgi:hypothetical protein